MGLYSSKQEYTDLETITTDFIINDLLQILKYMDDNHTKNIKTIMHFYYNTLPRIIGDVNYIITILKSNYNILTDINYTLNLNRPIDKMTEYMKLSLLKSLKKQIEVNSNIMKPDSGELIFKYKFLLFTKEIIETIISNEFNIYNPTVDEEYINLDRQTLF